MNRKELNTTTVYAAGASYASPYPVRPVDVSTTYVDLAGYGATEREFHPSGEQITKTYERNGVERTETRPARKWTSGQAGILVDELLEDLTTVRRRKVVSSREIRATWQEHADRHNAKVAAARAKADRINAMRTKLREAGIDAYAVKADTYEGDVVTLSFAEAERIIRLLENRASLVDRALDVAEGSER